MSERTNWKKEQPERFRRAVEAVCGSGCTYPACPCEGTSSDVETIINAWEGEVKRDTTESCAKIAAGHNGISPKDSRDIATKIRRLATGRE